MIIKSIRIILLFFLVLSNICFTYAQDQYEILTKNFKFEDGIYTNFEAFQQNQASISWDSVAPSLYTNPQTFITQVDYIIHKKDSIQLDSLWGICLNGIPYIRLPKDSLQELTHFAGLQVRGKICYFSYEKEVDYPIEMAAYNPLTGRPFRKAIITRSTRVKYEKMLHFDTGLIEDFEVTNFLKWIEDDPQLSDSIKELPTEEAQEKLFKCLLIYDDRKTIEILKK